VCALLRRSLLLVACLWVGALVVPRQVCTRGADALFDGDLAVQQAFADRVARAIETHDGLHFFRTGRPRFDGQSAIAIYQMAILGLGQTVLEHPELRDRYLPAMRSAADRLVDPRTLGYAASRYGQHGVVRMAPGQGHAYLGYVNLALGMLRAVDPQTRHAPLHDRLTRELARRLFASERGLIETYPGESWPPDVAAVAGSIGLHSQVTGTDRSRGLATWAARFQSCAVDVSGYLIQRLRPGSCRPADAPRGSGTAIASYFIAFADWKLSERLYRALVDQGSARLLGFGALREYAPGYSGWGDGNSGPVLLGVSVGATGYGLGAVRMHRDRPSFVELYRTANLFGVWQRSDSRAGFVTGGILGDALLLAMLTARRP
jgi:hypothetical protein